MGLKKLRPSPAMIVALIALFVALSGAAYAGITLSNNTVRSNHIVNGQVKTADLANNAVTRAKVRNNAVNSVKIADGGVTSSDIADGGVMSSDIADGSIVTADLSAAALASARGTVYQGYQDANIAVDGTNAAAGTVVLALPVPAGQYAITAKAQLNNASLTTGTTGECRLTTGTDWDEARTGLNIDPDVNDEDTLAMAVVGNLPTGGTIELRCTDFGTGDVSASWRKILAVQVGAIVKTALP